MNSKQEKKRQNEMKLLKFLNPALEYIFKIILKSRIQSILEKDLIINYPRENKDQLIDLLNYDNSKNPHNFEYNIYIFFGEAEKDYSKFIVENWKFKICTTNSQLNKLSNDDKKKLLKKLHIFTRSIQSIQSLLPLNSLIRDVANKNFDNFFQAKLYKESNIEMKLEDDIKEEKKSLNIELKEEKYINIQLTINYYIRKDILTHQDNLKKNYNEHCAKCLKEKQEQKTITNLKNDIINTNNNNNNNNELISNFSLIFDDVSNDDELMLSNVIQNSMINKKEVLKIEDIKRLKKEMKDKKKLDLEKLYSSCFENLEEIKITKNMDELLDISTIMNKEKTALNNVKYKFNFLSQNQMIDEIYKEIEGFEIKDLMKFPPKYKKDNNNENLIINDYLNNKDNKIENENISFKDLVDDYYEIKQIILDKN